MDYPDDTATSFEIKNNSLPPLPDPEPDKLLYRLLIGGLVAAILLIVIGSFVATMFGKNMNEAVIAIGAAAVGYLGGVLTPSPKQ